MMVALTAMVLATASIGARADAVSIEYVKVEMLDEGRWDIHTTLRHSDSGWEHFADAWRLVDANGLELARRTLAHPHVNEQPFTRSLRGVSISVEEVFVEAHDNVHGWSTDRVEINLRTSHQAQRYEVVR